MTATRRTPRERIERAFHVSFKLPEQAAELLDAHEAEVRDRTLAEAVLLIESLPPLADAGDGRHWYRFGQSRAAAVIRDARTTKEQQ